MPVVPKAPIEVTDLTLDPQICYFGQVNFKNKLKTFGILEDDRRRHFYIVGKTGMGKSTLLENMVLQDIHNGKGVAFLDPHGDSVEYILDRIPPNRRKDVVYFNPADTDMPFGFNMLEPSNEEQAFLLVSAMMAIFQRIWEGMWSARMEYILNNTLLALFENPGSTLMDVVRMLTDADYRNKIIKNVTDPMVRNFWVKEFASFNEKYKTEAISPILNKIGQFFSADLIRNILGQEKSTFNLREVMDNQKIFLANLSKGRLGENNSNLLGGLLVSKFQLSAMSRVDISQQERKDFYFYVDEFQNFTTDSFATILSEARKYRLNLIIAHQYIGQLTETGNLKIRNAVFGNVGTMLSFRVGSEDANYLEQEFAPIFKAENLVALDKYQVALKMSINGKVSSPFLANTIAPMFETSHGSSGEVLDFSRNKYGRSKAIVKQEIIDSLTDGQGLSLPERGKKKKFNEFQKYFRDTKETRNQNYQKIKFDRQNFKKPPRQDSPSTVPSKLEELKSRSKKNGDKMFDV